MSLDTSRPTVAVFAGIDPYGAAGISADCRSLQALNCHVQPVVTALTKQNGTDWQTPQISSREYLRDCWQLLYDKGQAPKAIKIGMVAAKEQLTWLAQLLAQLPLPVPVVFDPVIGASCGPDVWDDAMIHSFWEELAPFITILTPNISEAQFLLGTKEASPQVLAAMLQERGCQQVLLKGGHLAGEEACDYFASSLACLTFTSPRRTGNYRGTGCFLAASIAAALAHGLHPADACFLGKLAINQGLQQAYAVGESHQGILAWHHQGPPEATLANAITDWHPDLPRVVRGPVLREAFPRLSHDLGVYPIVATLEQLALLAKNGASTIQLRCKNLAPRDRLAMVRDAKTIVANTKTQLFINDYWQEAIAVGAYGVHLGQEDLETADLEAIQRAGLRLGISSHSYYEAATAMHLKPSYIALGPIKATTCKSMAFREQGFSRLATWAKMVAPIPVVAIGGLTIDDIPRVKEAGAQGLAAITHILGAPQPAKTLNEWQQLFGNTQHG